MVGIARLRVAIGSLLFLAVVGCSTTPYTNRSQLILVSQAQETELGAAAYQEALKKERLVRDPVLLEPVRRVGERIARAANKPDYRWEFALVDDPKQANAFALPGGKVAVYTGLFPIARDEAGLAAVIGHEVAHALARHGSERMSEGMLLQIGAVGLSVALGDASPMTRDAIMQAYGLGAQVGVLLPFSRSQEGEADRIGLILMAKAGYDPAAALDLWKRMEARGGSGPTEFLSTHPSYSTRQENIREWLPEARSYFRADPGLVVRELPPISGSGAKQKGTAANGNEPR
jgi:predicted Zn-dependent protease